MMIKVLKFVLAAGVGVLLLSGTAGCSTEVPPDEVGLYYAKGTYDGNRFEKCLDPSIAGDWEANNEIIFLPTSLRTWNVAGQGGDTSEPTVVSSKPQEGQPSGVPVNVWSQTNMILNTFCDANGGVVKEFWEKIGRRYQANTVAGWKAMMLVTVVPALEKSTRNVIRDYLADDLVANKDGIHTKVQEQISAQFAAELERLSGGRFFCGPTFVRTAAECPPVQLIIKDIDYNDAGIQQARNDKQKAVEQAAARLAIAQGDAAALLAEAAGKRDAAAALASLYSSDGWVKVQLQIEASRALIEACKVAKECRLVVGADGTLILQP